MANSKLVYFRGEKVPFEEDLKHEFKGHRTITVEELKPHLKNGQRDSKTRQQWSKYLCGLLNTGLGGTLYGGILDDGSVAGFSLSKYQKLHVVLTLTDLFKRIRPDLWKLNHRLRDHRYCWCDTEALTSFSFGFLHPFFIILVLIEPWDSKGCSTADVGAWGNTQPAFSAEDGEFYVRKHGVTEMYTALEMKQWREDQARLARRKERFHKQKQDLKSKTTIN